MKESLNGAQFKTAQYESRLARYYTGVGYERFVVVDQERQRVIVNDIEIDINSEAVIGLQNSLRGDTLLFSDIDLLQPLLPAIESTYIEQTTFIFPGRAGKRVSELIEEDVIPTDKRIFVTTSRTIAGSGRVSGVQIFDAPTISSDQDIMVIDDVVMSGATLDTIRRQYGNDRNYSALALLMLSPIQNQYPSASFGAGVKGFDEITVNTVYQGISGTPSVISLSSLTGDTESSLSIQTSYKRKYADKPELFDKALLQIKTSRQLI